MNGNEERWVYFFVGGMDFCFNSCDYVNVVIAVYMFLVFLFFVVMISFLLLLSYLLL